MVTCGVYQLGPALPVLAIAVANMRPANWALAAGMALFGGAAGYYKGAQGHGGCPLPLDPHCFFDSFGLLPFCTWYGQSFFLSLAGSTVHWQRPAMYFGTLLLGKTGLLWGMTDSACECRAQGPCTMGRCGGAPAG